MSKMEEFTYILLSGTTVVVILLATIWWSRRRRESGSDDEPPSRRPRTSTEHVRQARLRKFEDSLLRPPVHDQSPGNEQSSGDEKIVNETDVTVHHRPETPLQDTSQEHGSKYPELLSVEDTPLETDQVSEPSDECDPIEELSLNASASEHQEDTEKQLSPKPSAVVSVLKTQKLWPVKSLSSVVLDDKGNPIVAPIQSLEEFLQWFPGGDDMSVPCVPRRRRTKTAASSPRTLLCHDMMGGYKVDRFVQGERDIEDYHFYHWHLIDVFVYFSHNLVSIPPPSWTNSAHSHGVLSLGTFITEWKQGAEMCAQIFSNEFVTRSAVNQLVMMAEYYHLDGWLINIENPIAPQYILNVEVFLRELSEHLHERRPGSQVIWYDSVTRDGQLAWQNALNEKNVPFFNCCDGIFLNYNWNWSLLSQTRKLAGDRLKDVYVGIDVFGRGCPGGGGYNSSEAMDMIRKSELSAAIFAPGWVFETQDKSHFINNQNKFWSLLEQYCYPKGVAGIPLVTSFGRGYGRFLAIDGEAVMRSDWTNHSSMDVQPTFNSDILQLGSKAAPSIYPVYVNLNESYYNGGSLCVSGSIPVSDGNKGARSMVRLFFTEVVLKKPVLVVYTFKLDDSSIVNHYIQLCNNGPPLYVLLKGSTSVPDNTEDLDEVDQELLGQFGVPRSRPCELPALGFTDPKHYAAFSPLSREFACKLHQVFTGQSHLERNGWITNYFLVPAMNPNDGCTTQEIRLVCAPLKHINPVKSSFTLYVGELKLLNPLTARGSPVEGGPETSSVSQITNLNCYNVSWDPQTAMFGCSLKWVNQQSSIDPIHHTNVYVREVPDSGRMEEYRYIGRAHCDQFVLVPLPISRTVIQVDMAVQCVTFSRRKLQIANCPTTSVKFT